MPRDHLMIKPTGFFEACRALCLSKGYPFSYIENEFAQKCSEIRMRHTLPFGQQQIDVSIPTYALLYAGQDRICLRTEFELPRVSESAKLTPPDLLAEIKGRIRVVALASQSTSMDILLINNRLWGCCWDLIPKTFTGDHNSEEINWILEQHQHQGEAMMSLIINEFLLAPGAR